MSGQNANECNFGMPFPAYIVYWYVECTLKNRLDDAILMWAHNIRFHNKNENFSEIYLNIVILSCKNNFQGTQKRVRISHGKRPIAVRVIEVLLYLDSLALTLVMLNKRCHF